MASLDSLVLQEQEFLKNMVGRILSLKPGLVLVEKTVSRLAQSMLLARGISVMINIKSVRFVQVTDSNGSLYYTFSFTAISCAIFSF